MDNNLKSALSQQFSATIDMLEKAIVVCPEKIWTVQLWTDKELPRAAEFWYIAYHTIFWLDLYLSGAVEGFTPPAPFTLDELDPAGIIPDKPFTKEELLIYLEHSRNKCQETIENLTSKKAEQRCVFAWGEVSFIALLLDNMRHVQEHAAQLNMILGQKTGWSPRWITRAKKTGG